MIFDHSGHESHLKTHSELWKHIAWDNKSLILYSPNSENLTQMMLLWWEQKAMMGQQLFLGAGTGLFWHQQCSSISLAAAGSKNEFSYLSVLSLPFLLPQALSYLLGKKSILVLPLRSLEPSDMTFYSRNPTTSTKGWKETKFCS